MSYYLPFPDGPVTNPADFVGREREVVHITALVEQGRSLALVGPTGIGKSSLLIHLLQALPALMDQPPATAVVDLASVAAPGALYRPLLGALGQPGDDEVALEAALQGQRLLLGLDNLEQAGPGFSRPVRSALRALIRSGRLQVIAASEQPLALVAPDLGDDLHAIHIGPLPEREARALVVEMLARAGLSGSSAEVGEIVALATGHPGQLRRASELWLRSKRGASFSWQRAFRESGASAVAATATPLPAPTLETEQADTGFSGRLARRLRERSQAAARERPGYESEDISALLLALALLGTLALALYLGATWPQRLLGAALVVLLLGVALPWLGLRSGWQKHELFHSYLEALRMLPGLRALLRRLEPPHE